MRRLTRVVRKLLENSSFFYSVIEHPHDFDGEALERELRNALHDTDGEFDDVHWAEFQANRIGVTVRSTIGTLMVEPSNIDGAMQAKDAVNVKFKVATPPYIADDVEHSVVVRLPSYIRNSVKWNFFLAAGMHTHCSLTITTGIAKALNDYFGKIDIVAFVEH